MHMYMNINIYAYIYIYVYMYIYKDIEYENNIYETVCRLSITRCCAVSLQTLTLEFTNWVVFVKSFQLITILLPYCWMSTDYPKDIVYVYRYTSQITDSADFGPPPQCLAQLDFCRLWHSGVMRAHFIGAQGATLIMSQDMHAWPGDTVIGLHITTKLASVCR